MARLHRHKRKVSASGRRYVNQAKLEALVRYSPEQSALRSLIDDARHELSSGVRSDRGSAQLIGNSARSARPTVKKDYGTAISQVGRQGKAVLAALQALGPDAAPTIAAMTREGGGSRSRLIESRAGALNELTGRATDARAGLAAAIRQRRAQFSDTSRKVHERQLSLARERGAFTAATVGDLAEADRKLKVQLRGQTLASRDRRRSARIAS